MTITMTTNDDDVWGNYSLYWSAFQWGKTVLSTAVGKTVLRLFPSIPIPPPAY
jgi:hypothetical protein